MKPEGAIQPGVLPARWYAGGAERGGRPDFQVRAYNDDFYILRQSAFSDFEKPFLYLLFGEERAILFDTGAGKANIGAVVDGVMRAWLARHGRASIPLIVAHSHGHGDHVAGDDQFLNRPGVTVVSRDTASVRAFFGIKRWPDDNARSLHSARYAGPHHLAGRSVTLGGAVLSGCTALFGFVSAAAQHSPEWGPAHPLSFVEPSSRFGWSGGTQ